MAVQVVENKGVATASLAEVSASHNNLNSTAVPQNATQIQSEYLQQQFPFSQDGSAKAFTTTSAEVDPKSLPVDKDPRFLEMQKMESGWQRQSKLLQEHIPQQKESIEESEKNKPWIIGRTAHDKYLEADKHFLQNEEKLLENRTDNMKSGQVLMQQFRESEQLGRIYEANGDLEQAQLHYNQAQISFLKMREINEGGKVRLIDEKYQQLTTAGREAMDKTVNRLEVAQTSVKVARNTVIIVGATVATGGAFAAVGGIGGAVLAVGAGTTYGTVAGGLSSAAEQVVEVQYYDKSKEQALADWKSDTGNYAKQSAIASVGTLAGGFVGGKVLQGAGQVTRKLASGATAGGTNAGVSTTVNSIDARNQAKAEFDRTVAGQNLSPEEYQNKYSQFLNERGLSTEALFKKGLVDVATGAVSGATGAKLGTGAGSTVSRKVLQYASETAADASIGAGAAVVKAKIDGRELKQEDLITEVGSAMVGSAVGKVASTVSRDKPARAVSENQSIPPEVPSRISENTQAETLAVVADRGTSAGAKTSVSIDSSALNQSAAEGTSTISTEKTAISISDSQIPAAETSSKLSGTAQTETLPPVAEQGIPAGTKEGPVSNESAAHNQSAPENQKISTVEELGSETAVNRQTKAEEETIKNKNESDLISQTRPPIRNKLIEIVPRVLVETNPPPIAFPKGAVEVVKSVEVHKDHGEWDRVGYTYKPENIRLGDLNISPQSQKSAQERLGDNWANAPVTRVEQYFHNDPYKKYDDNWRINVTVKISNNKTILLAGTLPPDQADMTNRSPADCFYYAFSKQHDKGKIFSEWDAAMAVPLEERNIQQNQLLRTGHFIPSEASKDTKGDYDGVEFIEVEK